MKAVLDTWKGKIKGKDRIETWENYSILLIVLGAAIMSIGLGLTILTPKGIPAILVMMGSTLSFLSTVSLIIAWLAREVKG